MTGSGVPTWEEVARQHGRFLYTVAYRLTGNDDDAQDLVQEVLLRVRKGLSTYQPGNLEGWLSRITTNAFLDEVRRRRRRPAEVLPEEPERVAPPTPGADLSLESQVLPAEVQEALRRLPPEYRAAVVLCDVVGLSYEEIGATLDIPVGTVRSRIHRGRAQLREALS
jgi:RNA polymerase sigma-70 factor (ECF subfamily)